MTAEPWFCAHERAGRKRQERIDTHKAERARASSIEDTNLTALLELPRLGAMLAGLIGLIRGGLPW